MAWEDFQRLQGRIAVSQAYGSNSLPGTAGKTISDSKSAYTGISCLDNLTRQPEIARTCVSVQPFELKRAGGEIRHLFRSAMVRCTNTRFPTTESG